VIHNGIEYGDMQLTAEAHDAALKNAVGLNGDEITQTPHRMETKRKELKSSI
jgi:6-phosphogluconate dehydrogenase